MDIAKLQKLHRVCTLFVDAYEIRAPEDVYQTDAIAENAPELIEEICQIVGYYEDPD